MGPLQPGVYVAYDLLVWLSSEMVHGYVSLAETKPSCVHRVDLSDIDTLFGESSLCGAAI